MLLGGSRMHMGYRLPSGGQRSFQLSPRVSEGLDKNEVHVECRLPTA